MFIPSAYQKAIFSHVKNEEKSLLIQAVAGSGKSKTLIECLKIIPESERVLFCAFNKRIVDDLKSKVNGREIKTLNGLGFGMWIKEMHGNCKVMPDKVSKLWKEKIEGNVDKVVNRKLKWDVIRLVKAAKMNMAVPEHSGLYGREANEEFWLDLIDHLDVDCSLNLDEEFKLNFEKMSTMSALVYLCKKLLEMNLEEKEIVDFDDQIYFPVIHQIDNRIYDVVFVDETQDLNWAQRELVKLVMKPYGKLVAAGDFRQCQPPGTMVRVPGDKEVAIEDLKDGDAVVAWDRHSQGLTGRQESLFRVKVASRHYEGDLITVSVGDRSTDCTPNHKWVTKLNKDANKWVVYLMRREWNFKVGWCQLFGNKGSFHLGHRTRLEHADAAWILSVHDTKRDASIEENLVSWRFNIPLVQFKQSIASPNAKLLDQEYLDEFWDEVGDNSGKAETCLRHFGRDPEFPFYINDKSFRRIGRTTCMVMQACNLIEGLMNIPIPTSDGKKCEWKPISLERRQYSGSVYSLDVEKHPYYVANGIITHNSIYAFRGSDVNSMKNFKKDFKCDELPLSITYRCPRKVVELAKKIVPEIECAEGAKEGVIGEAEYTRKFESDDVVICRNNKPLMKLAFKLLKDRVPMDLSGNNLIEDLIKFINNTGATNLDELKFKIDKWYEKSTSIKLAKNKNADLSYFDDKKDVLNFLISESKSIRELVDTLKKLSSQRRYGVKLSTIHRFKGGEAEKVFFLDPDLLPSQYAKTRIAEEQEMNLEYVAITRTKNELNYVSTPD